MERSQEASEATISMELDGFPGVRRVLKSGFSPEVKEVFDALRNEISYLHAKWETCQQLFREPESVSALEDVAAGAFRVIWQTFRDDFHTAVCRITDPKESGPKKRPNQNLTLEQLLHAIDKQGDNAAFLPTLTEKLEEITLHCVSIRKVRDKIIGHFDMDTILQPNDNPLPIVNWEDLHKALNLMGEFMNEISTHFTGIHIDFVPTITGPAKNIVIGLREFKRLQKLEFEREQAELRKEFEQS